MQGRDALKLGAAVVVAAIGISASQSSAATILIDLNEAAGGATTVGGETWNTISAPSGLFDLVDDSNVQTGVKIGQTGQWLPPANIRPGTDGDIAGHRSIRDSCTDYGFTGFTGDASWVPVAAGNDYFFGGTGNFGTVVAVPLSGLVSGQEYTIDLLSSADAERTGDYYLASSDAQTIENTVGDDSYWHDAHNNTTDILAWQFIAPEDGNVWVVADLLDAEGSKGTRMNALRLTVVPEPTGMALLGVAGLFGMARRRRK